MKTLPTLTHRAWLTALVVLMVFMVVPLSAVRAGVGTPANPILGTAGCTVTLSFDAALSVPYYIELFDDLTLIYQSGVVNATAGQPVSFAFTFPSIGKGIPGIGVYLYENGIFVYSNDPFTVIDQTCQPACANGQYQGVTTAWTKLYWSTADNKAVVPDTFIEPNKRITVVDNEIPGWYKIAWSCKLYYIKTGTLQVNLEKSAKPFLNGR